jgi:hypothetical protein
VRLGEGGAGLGEVIENVEDGHTVERLVREGKRGGLASNATDRGRAAKSPLLLDRLCPDGRSVDLVGKVRGKRAVGRLGRDQPQLFRECPKGDSVKLGAFL